MHIKQYKTCLNYLSYEVTKVYVGQYVTVSLIKKIKLHYFYYSFLCLLQDLI